MHLHKRSAGIPVPAGIWVGVSQVGSGTGKVITGAGVPGFTRTDVYFWGHIIIAKCSSDSYYRLIQPNRHNANLEWHTLECAKLSFLMHNICKYKYVN